MAVYTLDTNVIIYVLRDDAAAVTFLREVFARGELVAISAVTEIELFGYSAISASELSSIERFLAGLTVIPLDSRTARLAGFLRRTYRLKTVDSAIAATAIATSGTLVTRNVRDFQRIPQLALRKI